MQIHKVNILTINIRLHILKPSWEDNTSNSLSLIKLEKGQIASCLNFFLIHFLNKKVVVPYGHRQAIAFYHQNLYYNLNYLHLRIKDNCFGKMLYEITWTSLYGVWGLLFFISWCRCYHDSLLEPINEKNWKIFFSQKRIYSISYNIHNFDPFLGYALLRLSYPS